MIFSFIRQFIEKWCEENFWMRGNVNEAKLNVEKRKDAYMAPILIIPSLIEHFCSVQKWI